MSISEMRMQNSLKICEIDIKELIKFPVMQAMCKHYDQRSH